MLVDRYTPEDVFARVPDLAGQTDPVLVQLDRLLDDDTLYEHVRAVTGSGPFSSRCGRLASRTSCTLPTDAYLGRSKRNCSLGEKYERTLDEVPSA